MTVHWLAWRMSLAADRRLARRLRARNRLAAASASPPPATFDRACPHRGAVLELVSTPDCACGAEQTPVHACALYDTCTLSKVRDKHGRTWRSCLSCIAAAEHHQPLTSR